MFKSVIRSLSAAIAVCAALSGCSTIPISVDPTTYTTFKTQVDRQKTEIGHPLIGLYSINFKALTLKARPEEANAEKGDWKVAAVQRGASIDFISLSGYKGFGGGSDQGASFSVNIQGATLWSFPFERTPADPRKYVGTYSGIMGPKTGAATLELIDGGWLRIQTLYPPTANNPAPSDTFFFSRLPE